MAFWVWGFPFSFGHYPSILFQVVFFVESRKTGKTKMILFWKLCLFNVMGIWSCYLVHLGWFFRVTTKYTVFMNLFSSLFLPPFRFQMGFNCFCLPSLLYIKAHLMTTIGGCPALTSQTYMSREILKHKSSRVFLKVSNTNKSYFERDKSLDKSAWFSGQVKWRSSNHQIKCIQFTSTMCPELYTGTARDVTFLKYKAGSLLLHGLKFNWNMGVPVSESD